MNVERLAFGALLIGNAVVAGLFVMERPSHETLPLFVPVSLEYERGMRKGGLSRSGEEAVLAAEIVDRADLNAAHAASARGPLLELAASRGRLLALRNERHQLNVALMEVGVSVAMELDETQWQTVQRGRDVVRGKDDAAVFERVLAKLVQP